MATSAVTLKVILRDNRSASLMASSQDRLISRCKTGFADGVMERGVDLRSGDHSGQFGIPLEAIRVVIISLRGGIDSVGHGEKS
jgi:hypothetical protein